MVEVRRGPERLKSPRRRNDSGSLANRARLHLRTVPVARHSSVTDSPRRRDFANFQRRIHSLRLGLRRLPLGHSLRLGLRPHPLGPSPARASPAGALTRLVPRHPLPQTAWEREYTPAPARRVRRGPERLKSPRRRYDSGSLANCARLHLRTTPVTRYSPVPDSPRRRTSRISSGEFIRSGSDSGDHPWDIRSGSDSGLTRSGPHPLEPLPREPSPGSFLATLSHKLRGRGSTPQPLHDGRGPERPERLKSPQRQRKASQTARGFTCVPCRWRGTRPRRRVRAGGLREFPAANSFAPARTPPCPA
jgi:hypothetical protein